MAPETLIGIAIFAACILVPLTPLGVIASIGWRAGWWRW
jgi:hypothetical protein